MYEDLILLPKFQNKYRIPSARMRNYNYGQNGAYFVTICTHNKKYFFGNIVKSLGKNNQMRYSKQGEIARKFWQAIPNQFPFVILGEWIVMPNHVHGIIIINKEQNENFIIEDAINRVSTGGITGRRNPMKYQNVSTIIRWYKGITTYYSRKLNPNFKWQTRFFDHIIRNEHWLKHYSEYIRMNPQYWHRDRNNLFS